jgi:hypothetical protein
MYARAIYSSFGVAAAMLGGFKIELQQPIICGDNPVLSVGRQG